MVSVAAALDVFTQSWKTNVRPTRPLLEPERPGSAGVMVLLLKFPNNVSQREKYVVFRC